MTEYHSQNIAHGPLILFLTRPINTRSQNATRHCRRFNDAWENAFRPNARKEEFTAAALGAREGGGGVIVGCGM